MNELAGKHIVLGLSGGVACYKAADQCRQLIKEGATVQVVMTEAAEQFITPVTMQALSGRTVYGSQWDAREPNNMPHINLSREADAILIAGYGFGDEHVNSVLKNVLQAREGHRPPVMVLDFLKPEKRPLEGERSKGYEFVERTQSRWQSDVLTKLGMWDGVATLRHDFRRAKRLDQPLAEAEYAEEVRYEEYAVFFENAYPVAVWFGGFLAAADPGEEIANWLLGHVPGRSGM